MSPGSGPYEISTTHDTRVGRSKNETRDLAPKPVFANTDDPHPIWDVERLDNGNHLLSVRGAPTGVEKDRLVAFLTKEEHKEKVEWCLEELHPGSLRIKDPESGLYWTVLSFDEQAKVELKPLEAGLGDKQTFKFGVLE